MRETAGETAAVAGMLLARAGLIIPPGPLTVAVAGPGVAAAARHPGATRHPGARHPRHVRR